MTSLRQRRRLSRLGRLPSKGGEGVDESTGSCPSSPAVKKAYRLIVAGSARSGKSALVERFLNSTFNDRYLPTIENFHRKTYRIRGELHQLDILDTSGNDPFPAARRLSLLSGEMSRRDHP